MGAPRHAAPAAAPRSRLHSNAKKPKEPGLGFMGRIFVQTAVLGLLIAGWVAWRAAHPQLPPVVTPLAAPKMKELPEFDSSYKDDMLWGSYRSGHYFGMRMRTPRPLLAGLMWFNATQMVQFTENSIRHEAQQSDALRSYGWVRHDGRSYGRQQIVDGAFNITIQMVKRHAAGAGFGGDWAVRIKTALSEEGRVQEAAAETVAAAAAQQGQDQPAKPPKRKLSLLMYLGDAHWQTSSLGMWPHGPPASKLGQHGVQLLQGSSEDVGGPWALHLLPAPSSSTSSSSGPSKAAASGRLRYLGMRLQDGSQLVQLKQLVGQALVQTAHKMGFANGVKLWLPNHSQPDPNLAVFQVTAAVPAEFDLVFLTQPDDSSAPERLAALQGGALTALAAEREAAFDDRFDAAFPIASGPPALAPNQLAEVSKAALSNLLGSMGYFVGASRVRLPPGSPRPPTPAGGLPPGADPMVVEYWRDALFTATPSRSFFPRGFLWDEGFHQLLMARWDAQLSRDAIAHWLDLMNADGWIPREQILGKEARARVPGEFLVQHPSHANPPSLFLPLMAHAAGAAEGAASAADADEAARTRAFLQRAWPRLEAWYGWFNASQAGSLPGSYMWNGRDATTLLELNPKTLMSGLDDYPRASHPTRDERHVDLHAWMALASRAMADIGRAAGAPAKAVARYASAAATLGSLQRLQELHYDAASGHFCDYGLHTEAVALEAVDVVSPDGQPPRREMQRQVSGRPELQFVPAFGYVSLFPLLMQLLPADSDVLGQQLSLLRDEQLLWTPHGLRSLAPTSSIYKKYNTEHDAPYWRGQIWVNINFLALRALRHYATTSGPHQAQAAATYEALRSALLTNLAQQYGATGYLWEQYDDSSGEPKGSHPFTGWTALLTLVASEVF